jgi:putative ABC transport system permease protein
MSVLNKLTLQSLLKNRTRTIVTIIGVILSGAMITAVTTFVTSLQDFLVRDTIATFGDWHVRIWHADHITYETVRADNRVRYATFVEPPMPELWQAEENTLYVILHNPHDTFAFSLEHEFHEENRELLRVLGVSRNETFYAVIYGLATIIIVLIMSASVLMIFNSFAISVSERTKQFGLLQLVGATGQQVMKSVLAEAFYIGIVGIPLGIIAGIGGIGVTLNVMSDIIGSQLSMTDTQLTLAVSWEAVAVATVVGAVTVGISAFFHAIRASRISAIDAIRQSHDIKLKHKQLKTSRLTENLLGVEGMLADKAFKRNKKRCRATIISLFVSVVLFVAASSFGTYLQSHVEIMVGAEPYDILIQSHQTDLDENWFLWHFDEFASYDDVNNSSNWFSIFASGRGLESALMSDIYMERNGEWHYNENVGTGHKSVMGVHIIDDATYDEWARGLRIPDGTFATFAGLNYRCEEGRIRNYPLFRDDVKEVTTSITYRDIMWRPDRDNEQIIGETQEITMFLVDSLPWVWDIPPPAISVIVPYSQRGQFEFLTPQGAWIEGYMAFTSDNSATSTKAFERMVEFIETNGNHEGAGFGSGFNSWNVAEQEEHSRQILLVINIGVYGFISLVALITVANVFNTITTSIRLRRRELAVLTSVGMTGSELNKMMCFECLFYGAKALIFALPVSAGVSWLIYNAVTQGADVAFTLPWGSIGIAVAGVFGIVFITMMYSIGKVKRTNTVDALRSEVL